MLSINPRITLSDNVQSNNRSETIDLPGLEASASTSPSIFNILSFEFTSVAVGRYRFGKQELFTRHHAQSEGHLHAAVGQSLPETCYALGGDTGPGDVQGV